jgi:predicted RNA binding protein YcfA (HicA-like mRNA interferase family)
MRLPRDVSGGDLTKALRLLGYRVTRQTGSHVRLTTRQDGEHHVTVPNHAQLRIGTLDGVLAAVARHHGMTKDALIDLLFRRP